MYNTQLMCKEDITLGYYQLKSVTGQVILHDATHKSMNTEVKG